MKVTVIGAGKMGLPLACQLASSGARVTACDASPQVVEAINQGRMLFEEPGVADLLTHAHRNGLIDATTDIGAGMRGADVVIIIVPVLLTPGRTADLGTIEQVTSSIAANLTRGMMISYETTLPVGTTRNRLRQILETSGLCAGEDFDLVFSPERVKSRLVLQHLTKVPKIVGGVNARSSERAAQFYRQFLQAPVINVGTLEAAELAKLAGMVYRDVNIALANELAAYAEAVGVSFPAVLAAANTDGESAILQPGIGVGGHCTPVYPYFVLQDARERIIPMPLTETSRRGNDSQPARFLDRLAGAGVRLSGRTVLILGLAFRPQVKEHICSPAFLIREQASLRGARVVLHDPLYSSVEIRAHGFEPFDLGDSLVPEIVMLNTAHPEYATVDFGAWKAAGARHVIDGRNFWSAQKVRDAGLNYLSPGE